jgi:hypothetical protein
MKLLSLLALTVVAFASPVKESNGTLEKRGAVLTAQFATESEVLKPPPYLQCSLLTTFMGF